MGLGSSGSSDSGRERAPPGTPHPPTGPGVVPRGSGGIERLEEVVRAGSGVNLGELKHVQGFGMLYPPDPHKNDCTIEHYRNEREWPTQPEIWGNPGRAGRRTVVARHYRRRGLEKAGYGCIADPVDWFIGAEGTSA